MSALASHITQVFLCGAYKIATTLNLEVCEDILLARGKD